MFSVNTFVAVTSFRGQKPKKPGRARQIVRVGAGAAANGLGTRLRAARERAGSSVREFARSVGVSPSLVSQIENARVMPSVGTLYAIVNALGISIDALFRETEAEASGRNHRRPAATGGPVQRAHDRKTIRLSGGVRWERLTPTADEQLEFLYVVYEVGASSCADDALIRHGGTEYAYVLGGRLGIQIGFDLFELSPGESITFDAQTPHRLWTIGDEPAVAIWVVLNRHGDTRGTGSTAPRRKPAKAVPLNKTGKKRKEQG